MLDNVLVPLDRSTEAEVALDVGAALAERAGATLRVVIVIAEGSDPLDHEAYVEEICERDNVNTDLVEILPGDDVPATVIGAAGEQPGTVICMRSHGRSRIAQLVLGSTSDAVVRSGAAPVLLVGPKVSAEPSFDRLQVCVDGSALSESVLPLAVEWSKRVGSRLWLFEVVGPDVSSTADVPDTIYVHRVAERLREEHGIEADFDSVHAHDAADAIVTYAERHGAGAVALATHGRTGLRRVTLGSVAMKVTHQLHCPVLVLRPPEG